MIKSKSKRKGDVINGQVYVRSTDFSRDATSVLLKKIMSKKYSSHKEEIYSRLLLRFRKMMKENYLGPWNDELLTTILTFS